jgi:hypothetical protein
MLVNAEQRRKRRRRKRGRTQQFAPERTKAPLGSGALALKRCPVETASGHHGEELLVGL